MKKLLTLAAVLVSLLGLSAMATTSAQAQMFSGGYCGSGGCGGVRIASPPSYGHDGYGHRGGHRGRHATCPTGSIASREAGGCVRVLTEAELSRIPPISNDPRCDGRDGYWTNEGGMTLHHRCVYNRR